jgi:hypothetical protein
MVDVLYLEAVVMPLTPEEEKVLTDLATKAVAWKRSVQTERCPNPDCGVRIHRTPEELVLEKAVSKFEKMNEARKFESEAPTARMSKVPSSRPPGKRTSSRPPSKK